MGEEGWGVCRWQAAINYSFCHGPVIRKFIGNRAQWVRRPLAEFISRGEFHVPFIFQPKINEREFLLFRKEIIGKIIIAKRKRTCTCFPASDRDISKYKRINRSIYERRSSRDETNKKKKEKTFIDAFQNEEEKAGETFDSYTDLKNFQQFSRL